MIRRLVWPINLSCAVDIVTPERLFSQAGYMEVTLTLKATVQVYCLPNAGAQGLKSDGSATPVLLPERTFGEYPVGPELYLYPGDTLVLNLVNELGPDGSLATDDRLEFLSYIKLFAHWLLFLVIEERWATSGT